MKSLKRLITVVLALAMILTSVGIPAFAANFSDITNENVSTAVDKLVGFGIITGYEDGTFKPDNQITRAEFAAIVTRMKGVADKFGADALTGFSDLDNDGSRAWARPYVKAAVDLKIINGFEDGTFRAGEPVTYEQAVKMLVCAVGYEVVAQSELNKIKITNPNATWSAGYIAAAVKHGITKNAYTTQITEPANRGVVAVLTSNTLDVPELKENEDGSFEKVEEEEKDQNVQEIKGVVSGTYYTGLDAVDVNLSQREIMIGIGSNRRTYELTEDLKNKIDIEDLIGKYVVAYYDKIDQQLTDIKARNNTSTVIKEQDIISINGDSINYYGKNKNEESVSLAGYTKIYNGKYYPQADLATLFKNGHIELIEGGGQKVAKITSYEVFVVQRKSFNSNEEKIYFKYGKKYKGKDHYEFLTATASRPEVYVNGVKKAVSGSLFNEWTVINLLESPSVGGNGINKMYVTSGAKTGRITEGSDVDDRRKLVMDGKEIYLTYDYSMSPERVAEFKIDLSYSYYLDYTGQIAAVDKKAAVTNTKYNSGYIIGADDEQVRLILKDGTDSTVKMKKNVKIDGVSVDKNKVKEKLEAIAELIYSGESGCYQPVKYNITGSGETAELVALDTVASADTTGTPQLATAVGSNSDDSLVYNAVNNSVKATKDNVTIDGTLYKYASSAIVIYVPSDKSASGEYSVMSPSTAFAVEKKRRIEVLGADPSERSKSATIVLMYGDDPAYTFTGKTPYMVVTKVRNGGEIIEGYSDGAATVTTLAVSEDKFKTTGTNCVSSGAIEKGDIIRYIGNGKDSEERIITIAIEIVFDASEGAYLKASDGDNDNMYYKAYTADVGQVHMKYAEAFYKDSIENEMEATTAMGDSFTEAQKQAVDKLLTYKTTSSTVVYRVDGSEIIAENLLDNINTSVENPSEVIMITRSDASTPVVKAIYIVK